MEPQTLAPLTDEEILAVADEPEMVAKFTSDERRRLRRLRPSMGPAAPGTALPDLRGDNERSRTTVRDLIDRPSEAMSQMGQTLLSDLKDPATWAMLSPLLAGKLMGARATGPIPKPESAPSEPPPAVPSRTATVVKAVGPYVRDVVLGHRGTKVIEATQAAREALRTRAPESAPAAPPTSEAVPAPAPSPAEAPARTPSPRAARGRARTPSAAEAASADLSKAERIQAEKWAEQGIPVEVIAKRIVISRQLTGALKTPSADAVQALINQRNATGRWPE